MASKFIALFSMLAIVNAGVLSPVHYTATPIATVGHKVAYANTAIDSIASTHQNVVRNFDGTISTYSKDVHTPYSSVRKEDTHISNNIYSPVIQKTLTYGAAPVARNIVYSAAPVVAKKAIAFVAPNANTVAYAAPLVQKPSISYAAPVTKTFLSPVHSQNVISKPAVYSYPQYAVSKPISTYAAPSTASTFNQGSSATTYSHNALGVSGYGSSQIVHYSPAEMVSHMSFDGFGTHWGY